MQRSIELKIEDGYLVVQLIKLDEEGREYIESEDYLNLMILASEIEKAKENS